MRALVRRVHSALVGQEPLGGFSRGVPWPLNRGHSDCQLNAAEQCGSDQGYCLRREEVVGDWTGMVAMETGRTGDWG